MVSLFRPKQAVQFNGALARELQSDVSESVARQIIQDISPLKPGILIHDNACGYGPVTSELMTAGVPEDVRIYATDTNDGYLAQLRATIEENPAWKDTTVVDNVDMNKLSFADNFFDLSITNFAILGSANELTKIMEIMRVVKPGGLAIMGIWTQKPWQAALKEAHRRIRGEDQPLPPFLSVDDTNLGQLKSALKKAGYDNTEFVEKEAWVNMPDLKRWSTIAWTFLSTPVGGWTHSDEENWDQAIDLCVEELKKSGHYTFEDGIHKIRMVATVAFTKKE